MLDIFQISGLLTIIVSAAAAAAAFAGWYCLRPSRTQIGHDMANYFFYHGLFDLVTLGFGVAGTLHAPHSIWHFLYYTRVGVLAVTAIASIKLMRTYWRIARNGAE